MVKPYIGIGYAGDNSGPKDILFIPINQKIMAGKVDKKRLWWNNQI